DARAAAGRRGSAGLEAPLRRSAGEPHAAGAARAARPAAALHVPQAMSRSLTSGVVALALVSSASYAEGPTHRFAIIVGNDSGGEGTRDLLYARDDAKKLYEILLRLGG